MAEGLAWWLSILDLILVGVLRTRGIFANVLSFGQFAIKFFASVPAISLGERVLGLR